MTGIFALGREALFAFQSTTGRPVTGNEVLAVLGHLAIFTFIISAAFAWWWEHKRVRELEVQVAEPVSLTRDHILRQEQTERSVNALQRKNMALLAQIRAQEPRRLSAGDVAAFLGPLACVRKSERQPTIALIHVHMAFDGPSFVGNLAGLFSQAGWLVDTDIPPSPTEQEGIAVLGTPSVPVEAVRAAFTAIGMAPSFIDTTLFDQEQREIVQRGNLAITPGFEYLQRLHDVTVIVGIKESPAHEEG